MFENIGKKIKGLAKFYCWIGIIVSLITGLVFCIISASEDEVGFLIPGLCLLFLGPLFSWIGSWLLYSWGDIVDNVQTIKQSCAGAIATEQEQPSSALVKHNKKLDDLLKSGLITQEEYEKAIQKESL